MSDTDAHNAHIERSETLFKALIDGAWPCDFAEVAALLRERLWREAFKIDHAAQIAGPLVEHPGTQAGYRQMVRDAQVLAALYALVRSLIPAERAVRALAEVTITREDGRQCPDAAPQTLSQQLPAHHGENDAFRPA